MSLSRRKLQAYEADKASLFDQTAETRARNKTVFWWVLNVSYKVWGNEEESPVFGGDSYEERLAKYDVMEDSQDDMELDLIQRLVYYVSFWYAGRAVTADDFKALDEDSSDYGIESESLAEEKAQEEKAQEEVEEKTVKEKPKKRKPRKTAKKEEEPAEKELKKEG